MNEQKNNRTPFLSALCILTFIGSGLGFIGYFLSSVFFERVSVLIIEYSSWNSTDKISPLYFTALMALNALSLTGAIRIWKFHRDGFYLYIISQIILLFLPAIWINWQSFSITGAIFTVLFVVGYGLNWKILR